MKPKGCTYPENCGCGSLGCDNILCRLATQRAIKRTVAAQLRKQPDILLMRRFSAARKVMTRTDALAAARWMLNYAKDTKNKYRRSGAARTR